MLFVGNLGNNSVIFIADVRNLGNNHGKNKVYVRDLGNTHAKKLVGRVRGTNLGKTFVREKRGTTSCGNTSGKKPGKYS